MWPRAAVRAPLWPWTVLATDWHSCSRGRVIPSHSHPTCVMGSLAGRINTSRQFEGWSPAGSDMINVERRSEVVDILRRVAADSPAPAGAPPSRAPQGRRRGIDPSTGTAAADHRTPASKSSCDDEGIDSKHRSRSWRRSSAGHRNRQSISDVGRGTTAANRLKWVTT